MQTINSERNILIDALQDEGHYSIKSMFNNPQYLDFSGKYKCPIGCSDTGIHCIDFERIPSILIGGTSGTGKTTFIQSLLVSLMMDNNPDNLKFIIYDSNGVDYTCFDGSAYMLLPVIKEPSKLSAAINWLIAESNYRLTQLSSDINTLAKLPDLFIVLDDIFTALNITTDSIAELLQVCNKVKIHIILATSYPTAPYFSTLLKNNILCRMSFALPSRRASIVVLDSFGAELLDFPGHAIFKLGSQSYTIHTPYVSFNELKDFIKKSNEFYGVNPNEIFGRLLDHVMGDVNSRYFGISQVQDRNDEDELLYDAIECVVRAEQASVSMLQRRFRIAYTRAARLIDIMAEKGIVGPANGSKPRQVLLSIDQFDSLEEQQVVDLEKEDIHIISDDLSKELHDLKGLISIVRVKQLVASSDRASVFVDGNEVAMLKSGESVDVEVDYGHHVVRFMMSTNVSYFKVTIDANNKSTQLMVKLNLKREFVLA